jgi:L-threonylcarbamoyladenylate synthase
MIDGFRREGHYSTHMEMSNEQWNNADLALKRGELVVIPTDTIYGIVAKAMNPSAVESVYALRGRRPDKPCIILCGRISDLNILKISADKRQMSILESIWPNPVSIILDCPAEDLAYLHRGTKTLAVRIPKDEELRSFLIKTGPLIAPSANPEGEKPADTAEEARRYFGEKVGVYVKGEVEGTPSTLVSFREGKLTVIRSGAWKLPDDLVYV